MSALQRSVSVAEPASAATIKDLEGNAHFMVRRAVLFFYVLLSRNTPTTTSKTKSAYNTSL